jgi:hypothetical protein
VQYLTAPSLGLHFLISFLQQMEVCASDNRTPLPILDKTSSDQDCAAHEHRDAGEDRKRKIPVLLSKCTADGHIGHRTTVMVSEIRGVKNMMDLRQRRGPGNASDGEANGGGIGKLSSASLLER